MAYSFICQRNARKLQATACKKKKEMNFSHVVWVILDVHILMAFDINGYNYNLYENNLIWKMWIHVKVFDSLCTKKMQKKRRNFLDIFLHWSFIYVMCLTNDLCIKRFWHQRKACSLKTNVSIALSMWNHYKALSWKCEETSSV